MIRPAFEKIAASKRERLMSAAVEEFATQGFHKANVNRIAARSGISIGSLYNYFDTKEDLFSATFQHGKNILEGVFYAALEAEGPLEYRLKVLFRQACQVARKHPAFVQMYMNLASGGTGELTEKLVTETERVGSLAYKQLFLDAEKRGELDEHFDPGTATFVIDNNLLALTASFGSSFYRIRRSEMLGLPKRLGEVAADQLADSIVERLLVGLGIQRQPPKLRGLSMETL